MATTTTFNFQPSDTATPPYSFAFTAEGESYTGATTWNFAGQRWYLQVYDAYSNLLISHPLISSPPETPQNLAPGVFDLTAIYYSAANAQITVYEADAPVVQAITPLTYLALVQPITISINDITVTAPTNAFNPLKTNGTKIVDAVTGDTVTMKAINWSGGETTECIPGGLWQVSYRDLIDQVAAWGFNCIRIPFAGNTFSQAAPGAINLAARGVGTGEYDNLDFTTNNSQTAPIWRTVQQCFDIIINYCASKGLRVLLDCHVRTAGAPLDGLAINDSFTQADLNAVWTSLASHYSAANGFSNVVGADIFEEPSQMAWSDWVACCNSAIAAIQAVNSDWIIVVEGVATYNGVGGWAGGQLAGVATLQPTLVVPDKLVYSPHDYGQSVYAMAWLETTTNTVANWPNNLPGIWDGFWGFIVKNSIAPIWIGEFGGGFGVNGSGAADETQINAQYEVQWGDALVAYIQANGMSWGYWDLNPNSANTGGLLQDDWVTPQPAKLAIIQSILSE